MWAMRRQESVSTYEEVESLSSHQVSTYTSLEGSSCPSRLESIGGSSAGSLDHGLPVHYANNPPAFSAYQTNSHPIDPHILHPELQSPGSTDSSSRATSYSYSHSPGDLESPVPLEVTHDKPEPVVNKDGSINASVAKWVNQSYMQSPNNAQNADKEGRLRLSPKMEASGKSDTSYRSDSMDRLDADTSPKTYRSMSPLHTFTRTASLDSGFPQFPSGGGFGMPWTPAENMLMTLGFGAMDFGIPERFMQSWRDNVIKRRIGELNQMIHPGARNQRGPNNGSLSRQTSETDSMEDFKIPPKARVSPIQEQREQEQRANRASPEPVAEQKKDPSRVSPVPQPSEKQKQLEKISMMRRRFKKAATVGSFSSHLLPHSSQSNSANTSPCSTPELQRRQSLPNGRKLQLRPNDRGSARERRRKFISRQSSLPISLETLPEEDEGQRSKPQSISDSFMTQMSMSIDVGKDVPVVPPLKIVTEQASLELAESKSYNLPKQQSKENAIADLQEAKKNLLNMEQYLSVIKTMIDSKDSGIGNEPSNEGSPQISPRASASGDDNLGVTDNGSTSKEKQKNNIGKAGVPDGESRKLRSNNMGLDEKGLLLNKMGKEKPDTVHSKENHLEKQSRSEENGTPNRQDSRDACKERSMSLKGKPSAPSPRSSHRPTLHSMQEAFCQTVIEVDENEDDDVFITTLGKKKVDAATVIDVNVAVQTSPSLMSPLLSPLCAGPGSKLLSLESSFSSEKSKTASDYDARPVIVLAPDSMEVEVKNHALSSEDETSSTGTVNTQYSELSNNSNIDNMFPHQPSISRKSSGMSNSDIGFQEVDLQSQTSDFSGNMDDKVHHKSSEREANYENGIKSMHVMRERLKRTKSNPASLLCNISGNFDDNSGVRQAANIPEQNSVHENALSNHQNTSDKFSVASGRPQLQSGDTCASEPLKALLQTRAVESRDDAESIDRPGSDNSLSSQESRMDGTRQKYRIVFPSDGCSSTASTQFSSRKQHTKIDYSDQEDGFEDHVGDSSHTGSAYSTQSHDYAVPQLSHTSSGVFQLMKSELEFPEKPQIRASVVSSKIGRQYEALLKSALEKERARKHLTVAETLHLAVVKLENLVKERHLCRLTQRTDSEVCRGSCKFCDVKKYPSNTRYTQELQKRYSLKPEPSGVVKQQVMGNQKQQQQRHRLVERTRSAPNELQRRTQWNDTVRDGAEARMNSISSDFNDAVMSVTGDNLIVDLGKVSEELPSDMSFSDMTDADVKSIQAFHVLNESESLSLAEDEDKDSKKEEKRMPLQQRRSLFAQASRSGSRLLLQKALHRTHTQSTIERKLLNDVPSFDHMTSIDNDAHSISQESERRLESKSQVPLPTELQPNMVIDDVLAQNVFSSTKPSNGDENVAVVQDSRDISKYKDDNDNIDYVNQSSSCFIVVNSCQPEVKDNTELDQCREYEQPLPVNSAEITNQRVIVRSTSSDRSSEPTTVPPCSPYQKLTPQLSHSSKRSPPLSPNSFMSTSPSLGAFLSSPLSPITKSPPRSPSVVIGESPVPSHGMRISVSPTVHLAPSPPPSKVTVELRSLFLQPSPTPTLQHSEELLSDSAQSKYRSELFLQLPEQPDGASQSGLGVSSPSSFSIGRSPITPAGLEYVPSFDELCDKAETIITNLQGIGSLDNKSSSPRDIPEYTFMPVREDPHNMSTGKSEDLPSMRYPC